LQTQLIQGVPEDPLNGASVDLLTACKLREGDTINPVGTEQATSIWFHLAQALQQPAVLGVRALGRWPPGAIDQFNARIVCVVGPTSCSGVERHQMALSMGKAGLVPALCRDA
jgi:hypothetical protein